ncbi:hypothetical protein NEIG_01828 [Nematocida sp. ERTm5]|nr:hypothetical protein NEIG_01828 [Nematocida sp. ERTm5]
MSTLESECLQLINESAEEFSYSLQRYKLEVLSSKKPSKHSDSIFGYFFLYLLAKGDTRRYSLNRMELSSVIDLDNSECIRIVDHIWKCNVLGDIPQMKQAAETLPKTHLKLGQAACEVLQEKKNNMEVRESGAQESKLQKIVKASNMFFRV